MVLGAPAVAGQDLEPALHVAGKEEEVEVLRVPVDAGVVGVGVGPAHQEPHPGPLEHLDGPGPGPQLVPVPHPLRRRRLGGELAGVVRVPRLAHARAKVGRRPLLDTPPDVQLRPLLYQPPPRVAPGPEESRAWPASQSTLASPWSTTASPWCCWPRSGPAS